MDDTQVTLTTKQVLFNFSISREQLRRWTEKGLQKVERGQFDLRTFIKFRDEFILGSSHDEMGKVRLRREKSRARFQELLTAEKEDSLISRENVLAWLREVISEVRGTFRQLPFRLMEVLAVENEPRSVFHILRTEIDSCLRRLATARVEFKKRGPGQKREVNDT